MRTRAPYGMRRREGLGFDFLEVVSGRLAEVQEDDAPRIGDTFREYNMAIPEGDGRQMNFEDFPFQEEWYSEEVADAEEVIMAKSAQVGASRWGWIGAVRETDLGATTLYIFPTADHVREFGDERIEPAIAQSAYLRSKIALAYVKTKTLKRIGRGFLHLRGSNSKAGAQSVAAQVVFFDENDLLDQCLVAGTMVVTRRGHIAIEDVVVDDEVLTHRGRWRRVTRTGGRVAETVRVDAHGVPGLVASETHPVYARRRAGKVLPAAPRKVHPGVAGRGECGVPACDLPVVRWGVCSGHRQRWRARGPLADSPIRAMHERGGRPVTYRIEREGPEWIEAAQLGRQDYVAQVLPPVAPDGESPEWWWFVGRYLADGCADGNSVHIDCAAAEADGLEARLRALFDNAKRKPYALARAVRFTVSSRALCRKLEPYGRWAHGKRLTGHALALSKPKARELLDGYLTGGGSYDAETRITSATSTSRALALGVAMLVQRVHGVVPACFERAAPAQTVLSSLSGKTVNARIQFRLSFGATNNGPFVEDGVGWKPIKRVQPMGRQRVFNLTVEEDNSFVADNCAVHNSNLAQIERRLSGARQIGRVPKTRRLGYPFTPNDGIDAEWQSSDQRVWHVMCPGCGDEQPLVWEENFRWTVPGQFDEHGFEKVMRAGDDDFEDRKVVGDVWRQCRSCEATLEDAGPHSRDGALRKGRWVPQKPGSRIIGFHAWRGMVPTTDMRALVVNSRATKETDRETFMVLDLGRPYVQGDARLTDEQLREACAVGVRHTEFYEGLLPTTMGVDVAGERDLNVVIHEQLPHDVRGQPNPRQALWIGTCRSFEEVRDLIHRFRCIAVAVDSNPERRLAKALRLEFPGRVVLVEYHTNVEAEPIELKPDEAGVPLKVRVNRTDAIDGMMDAIRQRRDRPTQNPPPGWMPQMKALVRKTSLDTKGRPYREYVTTGSEGDDYAHAHTFGLVATELWRSFGMTAARIEMQQGQPLADAALGITRLNLQRDMHEG